MQASEFVLLLLQAAADTTTDTGGEGRGFWAALLAGVAVAANIGSLVGFAVTVWAAFRVRRLRRRYVYLIRSPELRAELEPIIESVADYLLFSKAASSITKQETVSRMRRATEIVDILSEKMDCPKRWNRSNARSSGA